MSWFLLISFLGSFASAQFVLTPVQNTCDAFRAHAFRDQFYETRISNCEKLIRLGTVPNSQAINYTLKYLAQNYKGLKDSTCAMDGLEKDFSCRICKKPTQLRQGIQNGCSFLLNDLKKPWGDGTTRTTGYYIDLCKSATEPTVQKFYVNVGTGTIQKKGFNDETGENTTLPGAFLTDDQVSEFMPYNPKPYQDIQRKLGGKLPGIRLVGLNSSNNSSEDSKPMHVSPFKSSWGCPSVGPDSAPIMYQLVQNGPALLMNYHSEKYEQKNSCRNDDSSASSSHRNSGAADQGAQ